MRVRGGQAVVRALEDEGVEVIFGIPGVHTLEIYDALVDSPIRHILARHEQGAGYMADGYARASGRPGVACVITGPGLTNIATPLGEAYTDSSPVLVVSSNVELPAAGKMLGHLHDLKDQLALTGVVTKWNGRATSVEDIPRLMARAFEEMANGRERPTHVEVPLDVLAAEGAYTPAGRRATERPAPDPDLIEQAATMIADAERVLIWCGGGAVSSEASEAIGQLARRLGAPVVTSVMGKGAIAEDHPWAVGNRWEPGNPVDQAIASADLALVFGSKLGPMETDEHRMRLPDRIVRVDIDPTEIQHNYQPALAVVADARLAAQALLDELARRSIAKRSWTAEAVARINEATLAASWGNEQAPYIAALRAAIPRDGILVNDMTMMSYLACKRYPVYQPRTFLFPQGFGTLGFALPAAIGAKVARPDAVVVPIVGDGGFQFTMQELATAIQFRLGLPIVIFNDATYTAVKMEQAQRYDRRYVAVDLVNPDYVQLAAAYGIPSARATSPEQLAEEVARAARRDLPTIIDAPIQFTY